MADCFKEHLVWVGDGGGKVNWKHLLERYLTETIDLTKIGGIIESKGTLPKNSFSQSCCLA